MASDLPTAEQLEAWAESLRNGSPRLGAVCDEVAAFLRSDRLKAALATLEAVEWIEATGGVNVWMSHSHLPEREPPLKAHWGIEDSYLEISVRDPRPEHEAAFDSLLEAVAALKSSRIEKES